MGRNRSPTRPRNKFPSKNSNLKYSHSPTLIVLRDMSDNRLIRGPNSASLITQWHDVAVATVGVMIHEEFGQLNVAKLQTECLAKYESLMDHSEMVKLYPQFAEEVAEKQWVSPIRIISPHEYPLHTHHI